MAGALPHDFAHSLDALKGWLPGNMGAVDKNAQLSANVTIYPVYAGRVVHLNSVGQFEMGAVGNQMPIFLRQNSTDPDVYPVSDNGSISVVTTGIMAGLVAIGAYELSSTEFDTTQTYHYNDYLRATASNTNASTGGLLTNQSITLYTNNICGVVSAPPALNENSVSVISFWPVYLPGTPGN
jgi:hypothetical protein